MSVSSRRKIASDAICVVLPEIHFVVLTAYHVHGVEQ